jgi:hypothetical protein
MSLSRLFSREDRKVDLTQSGDLRFSAINPRLIFPLGKKCRRICHEDPQTQVFTIVSQFVRAMIV